MQVPSDAQYCVEPHWESPVHVAQLALEPLQICGVHAGEPAAPAATILHVPLTLAPADTEQASHWPLQAALQQTLSEQNPERQVVPVEHASPFAEP